MDKELYDFSGYATKIDLQCTDGRTIRKDAFKHHDGETVPLVWHHGSDKVDNILGHALLEDRPDGTYAYGTFNDTPAGQSAKILVKHKDITALSILANHLQQQGKDVMHGMIREVSLVLAGANPGALIDNVVLEHSDGSLEDDITEAIIYNGENLSLDSMEHADEGGETLKDIFETMSDVQKNAVYAMIAHALDGEEGEDGDEEDDEEQLDHSDLGGKTMKKNVFDGSAVQTGPTLTHAQVATIMATALKTGSLKEAALAHATEYGIENIDILFPDAQALARNPEWLKREDNWVSGVLSAIGKTPFSRVKSVFADMDFASARAKGYIKGDEKKEVYFKMAKRVTTPTTVYVKQKIDRDDMIDIVDFDAVAMMRFQMRTLLDEELAVAAFVGDGRDVADQYKINEENIRPIWTEEDLFCVKETLASKTDYKAMIKAIALTHKNYKGSGNPVLYTTTDIHTNMLWVEDENGRRIYESDATLCSALRVSAIVEVPHLEGKTRTVDGKTNELMAIKVNLKDYNFGADKGGQIATFDDFDIDFNQYKYLMETRCSGALTKAKSAQVYEYRPA